MKKRKLFWLPILLAVLLSAGLFASALPAPEKKSFENLTAAELAALYQKPFPTKEELAFMQRKTWEDGMAKLEAEQNKTDEEKEAEKKAELVKFQKAQAAAREEYARLEKQLAAFGRGLDEITNEEERIRYITIQDNMLYLYGLYSLGGIPEYNPHKALKSRIESLIHEGSRIESLKSTLERVTEEWRIESLQSELAHVEGLVAIGEEAQRQYDAGGDPEEILRYIEKQVAILNGIPQ